MNRLALLPTVLLAAGLLLGCGSGDSAANSKTAAPSTQVTGAGDSSSGGLDGETGGAGIYQARCASCHGADLRGTDKGPSQLSIVYEPGHHGDEAYRRAILEGTRQHHWNFGDMPAVEGITDTDVEAVITYIRQEQQRLGFER